MTATIAGLTETIQLHKAQYDFCHSHARYRGFVGGRGAGKSYIGAYDLLRRAKADRLYGVYAPTYPMLRDATWRSFQALGERLRFVRTINLSTMLVTLGNGAEVLFRSLDDPERARGPNLSGAWIDEASLVKRAAYDIIIAALREAGEAGWLSATFTPKGKQHWTYDVFGMGRPDTALFRARTLDNPFLPRGFFEAVRAQYTDVFASQELSGEFIDLEGNLASRAWFPIVDTLPAEARRHRYWDFAATEKSAASDDPDYTVGLLLAEAGGVYYVQHVVRERAGPGAVEALVRHTAETDGQGVPVSFEQEPGSAGKLFTAVLVKALNGWTARAIPATGDKATRAMPWLAQAEAGNFRLVRGLWNSDFLDEVCAFPIGTHDDQVDAVSGAYHELALPQWRDIPFLKV